LLTFITPPVAALTPKSLLLISSILLIDNYQKYNSIYAYYYSLILFLVLTHHFLVCFEMHFFCIFTLISYTFTSHINFFKFWMHQMKKPYLNAHVLPPAENDYIRPVSSACHIWRFLSALAIKDFKSSCFTYFIDWIASPKYLKY
jgi:hypothetical protein